VATIHPPNNQPSFDQYKRSFNTQRYAKNVTLRAHRFSFITQYSSILHFPAVSFFQPPPDSLYTGVGKSRFAVIRMEKGRQVVIITIALIIIIIIIIIIFYV
jgi:hypothetical protein